MTNPARIMVTGASGFVGRHLIPALRLAFPEALLLACSSEATIDCANFTLPLDLLDPTSIKDCVSAAQPDAVIHLAAETVVSDSFARPLRTWRVNVDGSLLLAESVMQIAPHALFLFISSAEVYGLTFQKGFPLKEDASFAPANPYAASKAAADIALGEMSLRGLQLVRLRPFNHTGPGQSEAFVVPSFARQIARIEAGLQSPVVEVGALDRWRDFLDVRDVCSSYIAALKSDRSLAPGVPINIASGTPRKIGDILQSLIKKAGIKIEVRADERRLRPTDVSLAAGNPDRANELLGWHAEIPWETTLDNVLAYWREKNHQPGR